MLDTHVTLGCHKYIMTALTHQIQILRHQDRMAEEAVIQRRHIAAHDQRHDARIIKLVAPFGNLLAVVHQGVIRRAHAQTHHGAAEEARKDQDIRRIGRLVARMDHKIEVDARDDGDDGPREVRPDVDKLVVQVEERPGRLGIRWADGPVAGPDEGVVAAPGGQIVPEEEKLLFDFLLDLLYRAEAGFGEAALAEGV